MSVEVPQRFRVAASSAAGWAGADPVLLNRELGVEKDTGRYKIGNGSSTWSALPYIGLGWSVILAAIAGLTPSPGKAIYFVDAETADLFNTTEFGRDLVGEPSADAVRFALGLGASLPLDVSIGGTGADNPADALINLGIGGGITDTIDLTTATSLTVVNGVIVGYS